MAEATISQPHPVALLGQMPAEVAVKLPRSRTKAHCALGLSHLCQAEEGHKEVKFQTNYDRNPGRNISPWASGTSQSLTQPKQPVDCLGTDAAKHGAGGFQGSSLVVSSLQLCSGQRTSPAWLPPAAAKSRHLPREPDLGMQPERPTLALAGGKGTVGCKVGLGWLASGSPPRADHLAPAGLRKGTCRQEQRRPAISSIGYRGSEFSMGRNWTAAKDMQRYRRRCPGLEEREEDAEEEETWNLSFYKNEIQFLPHGLFIDELLEAWQEGYETLEENHPDIQWLFPLHERGMNWRAKPITHKEIQAFKKSAEVMQRFVRAYKLTLGFYGINLISEETGEVRRAENWLQRFRNLDRFSHNNLRITRIVKCLGEMGYEHYQVQLVTFFLTETLVSETLTNVKRRALDYFLFTIRNKQMRRELIHYAWQHFRPRDRFVWGPHKKLLTYKPQLSKSELCPKADEEKECARDKAAEGTNKTCPVNREGTTGDAKASQIVEVTDECISEELNKHGAMRVAEQGDRDLSEDLMGLGDGAECDGLKESKKRKLEMNRLSGKCPGPLKSPTDIERISYNLEEFAINQETTEVLPELLEKDDSVAVEEDDMSSGDLKVSETSDAAVKRRKVDEAMPEKSAVNVAIPLDADTTTCSTQAAKPEAVGCGAENGEVREEDTVVEEMSVQSKNGAAGASLNSLRGSELTKITLSSWREHALEHGSNGGARQEPRGHARVPVLNKELQATPSQVVGPEPQLSWGLETLSRQAACDCWKVDGTDEASARGPRFQAEAEAEAEEEPGALWCGAGKLCGEGDVPGQGARVTPRLRAPGLVLLTSFGPGPGVQGLVWLRHLAESG
ncbi:uncharacterized protein LOC142001115 [Carettochelys insculpta]|uniref:uncharacterized protein LOC142001115 n=1 Tax=Carettochelys insculpta TaxID=44489 RepID=UPI003EB86227